MAFNEKAKIKTPPCSVWNALVPWNSKSKWFCVCENITYKVTTIMAKYRSIFGKLTLNHCFNSAFLLLKLNQMKEIPFVFALRKKSL